MSELEERFHRVMGGMIGNESLVSSLDDDAARELFSWGESAARRIVDETDGMDDDTAEQHMAPRLRAIRSMMRSLSRWIGEAESLDTSSREALWNRVGEQAGILFDDAIIIPSMQDVLLQLPANANALQVVAWFKELIEEKKNKG